jgi:hypothetical protein
MSEQATNTLLIGLSLPNVGDFDQQPDPEMVADGIAAVLREEWESNQGRVLSHDERPMVSAIPAAQWLTAKTMGRLRTAASLGTLRDDVLAVLTVYDEHVPVGNRGPWRDRLYEWAAAVSAEETPT